MARQSLSVSELAREADTDLDEVLVTLWDLGINHVLTPHDVIKHADVKRARRALGVATRRELRLPGYWCTLLGINQEALRILLVTLGTPMGDDAVKLPSGAVSRLKAEARRQGIDPLTGVISQQKTVGTDLKDGVQKFQQASQPLIEIINEWSPPGHNRTLRWLSAIEIKSIHFALVEDFAKSDDPIDPPGVRSPHLLESAAFRPQTALGEILKYPTVEASAAALLHALILDHPLFNGNKRTALVSMLVFLDENGLTPICDEDQLFRLVLQVAQHRVAPLAQTDIADNEVLAITEWLCHRTRVVAKGETPLPWRRFKTILQSYGCNFEFPGGVGNRINVTRQLSKKKRFLSIKRIETLQTQVFYRGEGSDASIGTIKKIREDLHLDDIHGVDSFDFYSKGPAQVSDYIAKYRKTLYRLAKL